MTDYTVTITAHDLHGNDATFTMPDGTVHTFTNQDGTAITGEASTIVHFKVVNTGPIFTNATYNVVAVEDDPIGIKDPATNAGYVVQTNDAFSQAAAEHSGINYYTLLPDPTQAGHWINLDSNTIENTDTGLTVHIDSTTGVLTGGNDYSNGRFATGLTNVDVSGDYNSPYVFDIVATDRSGTYTDANNVVHTVVAQTVEPFHLTVENKDPSFTNPSPGQVTTVAGQTYFQITVTEDSKPVIIDLQTDDEGQVQTRTSGGRVLHPFESRRFGAIHVAPRGGLRFRCTGLWTQQANGLYLQSVTGILNIRGHQC